MVYLEDKILALLIQLPPLMGIVEGMNHKRYHTWLDERQRQIIPYSFRRYVKTTISDLGYADYSEYFIWHSNSTYWRKKDSEKAEIFLKIEPYLTFLNVNQLERQGADIQTKME